MRPRTCFDTPHTLSIRCGWTLTPLEPSPYDTPQLWLCTCGTKVALTTLPLTCYGCGQVLEATTAPRERHYDA